MTQITIFCWELDTTLSTGRVGDTIYLTAKNPTQQASIHIPIDQIPSLIKRLDRYHHEWAEFLGSLEEEKEGKDLSKCPTK